MSEQATLSAVPPPTGDPPDHAADPPRSSRAGAVAGVLALLLGVATALLVGYLLTVGPGGHPRDLFARGDGTAEARIGDCVTGLPRVTGTEAEPAEDPRVAACGSAAAYEVVGRVQDAAAARTRSAAACEPYFRPGDDGYVLSRVGDDGDGYLLCLVHRMNGR